MVAARRKDNTGAQDCEDVVSRVSDWQVKQLLVMQAASQRHFAKSGATYVISSDGAKLGKPAEDTNVYLAAHHASGTALYLAP